jgi:ElaB/YqjD/DUF883 family membrane-anchored ribosome-binding protein
MQTKGTAAAKGGNIQHTLEHSVETATSAAHDSIDSVSLAARPALDHLVASAHSAVDGAGVAATHAAGTLGVRGDQLNDSGHRMVERAGSYVRENPVVCLGIAVAAGYLLSRLLSSR